MDCYLIKTANWVRDLYPHKAIRRVTAGPQDESFPGRSVENNDEREIERGWREQQDSIVKGMAHRCFILSAGFEVSGYDRGR